MYNKLNSLKFAKSKDDNVGVDDGVIVVVALMVVWVELCVMVCVMVWMLA